MYPKCIEECLFIAIVLRICGSLLIYRTCITSKYRIILIFETRNGKRNVLPTEICLWLFHIFLSMKIYKTASKINIKNIITFDADDKIPRKKSKWDNFSLNHLWFSTTNTLESVFSLNLKIVSVILKSLWSIKIQFIFDKKQ